MSLMTCMCSGRSVTTRLLVRPSISMRPRLLNRVLMIDSSEPWPLLALAPPPPLLPERPPPPAPSAPKARAYLR